MKTDRFVRDGAATAARGKRADFAFMGVAIVPIALVAGGEPDAAMLVFIPLLLVACLFGMWEQVAPVPQERLGARGRASPDTPQVPAATGVNLRRRLL